MELEHTDTRPQAVERLREAQREHAAALAEVVAMLPANEPGSAGYQRWDKLVGRVEAVRVGAMSATGTLLWMPAIVLDFRPLWCDLAVALEPLEQERAQVRGLGQAKQAASLMHIVEQAAREPKLTAEASVLDLAMPA